MTSVLLIYPFFKPSRDRSVFRFPPLGIAYIASVLRQKSHKVWILDCTFMERTDAREKALAFKAEVVGIYSMVTMADDAFWFADILRAQTRLLVAGGPLPTCEPSAFLDHFDVVVLGEGEQTMLDLLNAHETGRDMQSIAGIAVRAGAGADTPVRDDAPPFFTPDLDNLPFPARDLLPNRDYIDYGKKKYGHSITTIMSSRGCPFLCEFCSNVIFGGSYRERSTGSVVDEIEQALSFGYDRISFADDVFTMKPPRVFALCEEILRRKLSFKWECLGRVDAMDFSLARAMKKAGCMRIYFGIESGSERILKLMNKNITIEQARNAVEAAHCAGLEVGAFFILFYPGDTDATVLQTLHFAASLPLDYLGLSMPYPLPGTGLHARIRNNIIRTWRPGENILTDHVLLFNGDFSETKMRIGILKGQIRFQFKKRMGNCAPLLWLFDGLTDWLLRHLK